MLKEKIESYIVESNWYESTKSFEHLNLKDELLRGIYSYGFEKLSAIQQKAIKPIILGKDLIVIACSGLGKTYTYILAILAAIDETVNQCQALIIIPTRELACQIPTIIEQIANYYHVTSCICVGGAGSLSLKDCLRILKEGVQVVVGTAGRISEMILKNFIDLRHFKILVFDEIDEIVCRGFEDQINSIIKSVPPKAQLCMFSSTIFPELTTLKKSYMKNPISITMKKEELALEGVFHFYIKIQDEKSKYLTLLDICEKLDKGCAVVYLNRIESRWQDRGVGCSYISGENFKSNKEMYFNKFNTDSDTCLLVENRFSNDIDVIQANLVINYEMPPYYSIYLKRVGFTEIYGRKRIAINFLSKTDEKTLANFLTNNNISIMELPKDFENLLV